MTLMMACLATALSVLPGAAAGSAAVLPLEAKNGVSADLAELLTGNLVTRLADSGRFTRVVGTKEIEALLGYEKQKQLLQCESQSCLAELAGAMGVDFVVIGTLGRLGKSWLLNATLVNTTRGEAVARVSKTISGEEDALVGALEGVVAQLVGSLAAAGPATTAAAVSAPAAAKVTPEPTPAPAASASAADVPQNNGAPPAQASAAPAATVAEGGGPKPAGVALLAGGGAGLVLGAVVLVASVASVLLAGAAVGALYADVLTGLPGTRATLTAANVMMYAGPVGGLLLLVTAVLGVGVSLALVGGGVALK